MLGRCSPIEVVSQGSARKVAAEVPLLGKAELVYSQGGTRQKSNTRFSRVIALRAVPSLGFLRSCVAESESNSPRLLRRRRSGPEEVLGAKSVKRMQKGLSTYFIK